MAGPWSTVKENEQNGAQTSATAAAPRPTPKQFGVRFPVVALGASAGGLEALRYLFSRLPEESGMAFVVIQHLDPERPSMLTKVLEGKTRLSVVEATSGMALEPDRVHVIPSGADLTVRDGILALVPRQRTGRLHLPIDSFFRSLAADAGGRAIGVILSGSGADGTEGLRAIKAEGGITIAQEPDSAQFPSMPEAAITAGVVDFRGSPEAISSELTRLSRHPYVAVERAEGDAAELGAGQDKSLALILAALRRHAGVDFSGYKRTTVLRRIERRMALRHVNAIGEYARALENDPEEGLALARDMLIHVTAFFRDPDAFEALKEHVFEKLAKRKRPDDSIRIWVPGCATGEEVYALVIGLLESLDGKENQRSIKVFGTDLSDEAIDVARLGVYPESALAGVSPERLARFFERTDAGYRIGRRVRDLCVFVKHDLTRDPPFATLDLISCRNVLIYFDADLQRRVIPMLHYCLKPEGVLFLGQSEAITGFRDLFESVDKVHRIFVKSGESQRLLHPLRAGWDSEVKLADRRPLERRQNAREAQRQADHLMLTRYAPPGVIVNSRLEIIQFRGRTGTYLEPPPGQPQVNVLRMARAGLAAHLHEAVERAKTEAAAVRKDGLRVQLGSEVHVVDVEVVPLAAVSDAAESYFLILFEPAGTGHSDVERKATAHESAATPTDEQTREAERVKAELTATKDYLQSLMSEHESTADELAAANEELVAANEELQSINEELLSAKEELQSTNEELSTVNEQLRHRNLELDQVANDLVNVLASVEIPVIIVDLDLRVRRYTPTVENIARLIPEDVGRPIDDLKLKIDVEDLASRIQAVLDSLTPREWEVQGPGGRWFRMQIRPYRTSDNRLDGAILSFVDVDVLRRAVEDAESARDYAKSIVETVSSALVVLDAELRVVSANTAFHETFSLSSKAIEGKHLSELSGGIWDQPALGDALEQALCQHKVFVGLEVRAELPCLGRRAFSLSGRPILWGGGAQMVLLAIEDVTSLRSLESERDQLLASEKQARLEAERATRAKDLFLATLSHELRTPLSTMLMSAQLLRNLAADNPNIERPSASIERAASAQARLIDDLLDVSRIVSGKLMLDLGPVDFTAVVREAVDVARASALAKGLELDLSVEGTVGVVYGDEARLLQVVNNLLTNAIKFTPRGGHIWGRLEGKGEQAELAVTDTGMGIRAEVLPQLFNRFVQADSAMTRTHGGLGLGLSIVRHLVEVHGGAVDVESPGEGKGSTFRITLPTGTAAAATAPTAPRLVARSIEGVRILLVEDDDDTREAYAAMLVEMGTHVRAEPSAARALAALSEFHPDVILSDIAMPGEDGFSFIQKVRRLDPERGGHVPAAALTALASDEDRRRALQSGFQLHVPKPVDAAKLASVVATLVDWKTDPRRAGQHEQAT
jgi:two-component system, chemotaxis family, CheB/CheR fusion protein